MLNFRQSSRFPEHTASVSLSIDKSTVGHLVDEQHCGFDPFMLILLLGFSFFFMLVTLGTP
jgi:hypothetical protein